jgi:hypothetical protein
MMVSYVCATWRAQLDVEFRLQRRDLFSKY